LAWERKKYEVSVNRTRRTATAKAGKKTVLESATPVVERTGSDLYAPFEGKEKRVQTLELKLNAPTALLRGKYFILVRVGDKNEKLTDAATVMAGGEEGGEESRRAWAAHGVR
jgi:hypothetical protein